jgi:hypothetical protein
VTPPPKKADEDKVYIGIPKWVMPAVVTIITATIITGFSLVFALFGRVSEIEKTLKSNMINKEEYLQLKFEHQQLMESRKTTDDSNQKIINWIDSQQQKDKRR